MMRLNLNQRHRNRSKSETLITLPVGPWFSYFMVGILTAIVASVWLLNYPKTTADLVLDMAGTMIALIMIPVLMRSKRIESKTTTSLGDLRMILPGLWQGGLMDETFSFEKYDLDFVVDLRTDSERPATDVKVPIGKRYIRWPLADRELPDELELNALATLLAEKTATKKVGVFCLLGINRSGLVCASVARAVTERGIESMVGMQDRVFNEAFAEHIIASQESIKKRALVFDTSKNTVSVVSQTGNEMSSR